jgi:hypothetical protein
VRLRQPADPLRLLDFSWARTGIDCAEVEMVRPNRICSLLCAVPRCICFSLETCVSSLTRPASRHAHPDTAPGKTKPLAPVRDERCQARGTTPVRHVLTDRDLPLCIHRNPLTRVSRRRLLVHRSAVRGEAPRSYSPANPIPLLSDRGSLHRLDRLLVLIVALTIFNCRRALCPSGMGAVNINID